MCDTYIYVFSRAETWGSALLNILCCDLGYTVKRKCNQGEWTLSDVGFTLQA